MFFNDYANVKEHCVFIILQTLWECYFWTFSEHSETSSEIKKSQMNIQ